MIHMILHIGFHCATYCTKYLVVPCYLYLVGKIFKMKDCVFLKVFVRCFRE